MYIFNTMFFQLVLNIKVHRNNKLQGRNEGGNLSIINVIPMN